MLCSTAQQAGRAFHLVVSSEPTFLLPLINLNLPNSHLWFPVSALSTDGVCPGKPCSHHTSPCLMKSHLLAAGGRCKIDT